jgi:predicted amidohydrolase YtcJ
MEPRRRPRMRPALAAALAGALTAALAVGTGAYSGWGGGHRGASVKGAPDLVLYNGKISTVDERGSTVQAVAIRDGEIVATGRSERIRALARRSTKIVNLRGRRVLPGLIDGHLHGLRNGYHCFTQAVRLDNVTSRQRALALYEAKAAELVDDRWIFTTTGWTTRQLDEPGMLTLQELDAAAPDNPVWVQSFVSFQGVQVNTRALEVTGLHSGMPGVVLDANGEPTGQLTGPAVAQAGAKIIEQLDALSIDQQARCLADFIDTANALGLTAWKDPEGNQQPFNTQGACSEFAVGQHGHQPVIELWRRNRLTARVAFHLMNDFQGLDQVLADTRHVLGFLGDDRLRYLGVGEEVLCPGNQPPPPDQADEYLEISKHLARNRLSFENHASRSETQVAILDAWEQANEVHPIADLHWTIAHPGEDNVGPTEETLARAARLGIGMTPSDGGSLGGGTNPPFRRILESGVRMCLASDAMNVAPFTPFVRLWYAVSGRTFDPAVPGVPADQRLTRAQALRASTAECAWNLDQEGRLGSIEPGKHADLIVLSDDYFRVPTDDIRDLRSLLTVVGGRVVHAEGPFAGLDGT